MLGIFSRKNRCLGIDVGTTGVKIAELKLENNTPVLTNYAFSYDSGSLLQSRGLELLDDQVSEIVGAVLKRGNFSTKRTVLGIPGFLALISFVDLPEMPQSEIEQAIRFEAGKYIPTPLNEVSLGWEIVGSYQDKPVESPQMRQGTKLQVMVVTVPKNAVAGLTAVAKRNRLNVTALEVESFATVRCLIGNDKGTFMIVNVGAKVTDFVIVSDGIVRVTRSIDLGGTEISRSLASGLGIDLGRADKLKKSNQIDLTDTKNKMNLLINPVVGMILDEVKRLRELYHRKSPLKKIEKIIFTGGTSKMNSLVEYFANELSLDCQLGNSLARIGVEKKYEEVVKEAAPELTVAIGLALRGLGEK